MEKTQNKICADCKKEFIIDSGDLVLYEKVGLKIPEQCFECRLNTNFTKGKDLLYRASILTKEF